MENAVDALKIAAAILIFIIAIASSFSLFGIAKQTADSIITMRDRQSYLDAAELDGGILYTSASEIQKNEEDGLTSTEIEEKEKSLGVTTRGDRIVELEDVISTVYRYAKEKYGVTIVTESGEVLARYDSNTEELIRVWNEINTPKEIDKRQEIIDELNKNTCCTKYVSNSKIFDVDKLKELYTVTVSEFHNSTLKSSYTNCELIWGNEMDIQERIAYDFKGGKFEKTYNRTEKDASGNEINIEIKKIYEGKNLINNHNLENKKIVEVTNEIDNSTYLKQTDENGNTILDENGNPIDSTLLQSYSMPTIEIVYIILN